MLSRDRLWTLSLVIVVGLACLATACSSSDGDSDGSSIKLNEILALSDSQSDWIELYNPTSSDVALTGYVLQDQSNYWVFSTGTIKAGSFLQVICDGSGKAGKANFKLTSKGEQVSLRDDSGKTLDSVNFPAQIKDVSWGRSPDGSGAWRSLNPPTPGASNTSKGQPLDFGPRDGQAASSETSAGKPTGAACTSKDQCISQVCHKQICVSTYPNKVGEACSSNGACLSLVCTGGKCVAGSSAAGTTCLYGQECASGTCTSGTCAAGAKPDAAVTPDAGAPDQGPPDGLVGE